jgi:hypothetical protein
MVFTGNNANTFYYNADKTSSESFGLISRNIISFRYYHALPQDTDIIQIQVQQLRPKQKGNTGDGGWHITVGSKVQPEEVTHYFFQLLTRRVVLLAFLDSHQQEMMKLSL